MATKKKAKVTTIKEKSKAGVKVSKPSGDSRKAKAKVKTRGITPAQYSAAVSNLEKARAAKKEYMRLREQGFTRENVYSATATIEQMLRRNSNFLIELNPAVSQLMDEIGDFRTASELASMTNKEFYRYATSLNVFLASPLSDPEIARKTMERVLTETIKAQFTRRDDEDINQFKARRREFISSHEDIMKDVFELYRRVEETNAGQILKNISPAAYGSENLITDLTEFIENEYDGDMQGAVNYWQEQVTGYYKENIKHMQEYRGKELNVNRYEWRRGYAKFKRSHES